jgi:hypothetical protein
LIAADGRVRLDVPPGAVSTETTITVDPVTTYPEPERVVAGTVFDFGPDGTQFANPVQLTIQYDVAGIPTGVAEGDLRLLHRVGDNWVVVPGSSIDVTQHTVRGDVTGFSEYAAGPDCIGSPRGALCGGVRRDDLVIGDEVFQIWEGQWVNAPGCFAIAATDAGRVSRIVASRLACR